MADSVPTYGDLETKLILKWVDTSDVLATQRAIIEVTPSAAFLELPRGLRGQKGEKGDPGPGLWFRNLITSKSQLPTDLRQVDAGAAYPDVNSRSLWVWDGRDYLEIPNFIGMPGAAGKTPRPQIGSVVPGRDASVSINHAASTEESFVLDFVLPQGPQGKPGAKGDPGDAGKLADSPDVDMARAPLIGESLMWTGQKWAPRTVLAPTGPWILSPNDFKSVDITVADGEIESDQLVASVTVPGLAYDWRPLVINGQVNIKAGLGIRVDAEVRVGNAQSGDVVGRSIGTVGQNGPSIITASANALVTPGASYGVVKANTATTFYVVLKKRQGTGSWSFIRDGASLAIMAQPVNTNFN